MRSIATVVTKGKRRDDVEGDCPVEALLLDDATCGIVANSSCASCTSIEFSEIILKVAT
jgi:hypothetical protein